MILHKLLFFKLPYRLGEFFVSVGSDFISILLHRYATAGDADGEPLSREEESEKMERLEKEVLDYPGLVFPPYTLII
jgi:hypothetical protein